MPQTIDRVLFVNSDRSKLIFCASPLTFGAVLDDLSDTAESSLF